MPLGKQVDCPGMDKVHLYYYVISDLILEMEKKTFF